MIKGINVGEDIYKIIHIISIKANGYVTTTSTNIIIIRMTHIVYKVSQVGMTQLHIDHKCMWPQSSLA